MLIAVSLVLVLVLAGCTGQNSDQGSSKDENLKVGAILPLSGPLALYGNSVRNSMELAKSDLREKGVNISVVYSDSRGEPKDGISAYKRLTTLENVDVVFSIVSRVSVPLISNADEDKIPMFMSMTSAGDPGKSKYVYRLFSRAEQWGEMPISSVASEGRVAVIHGDSAWPVAAARAAREKLKSKKGVGLVASESFRRKATTFKTQLTKIKREDPDFLIVTPNSPSQLITIFKESEELGLNTTLFDTAGMFMSGGIREKAGEIIEGSYTATYPAVLNKAGKSFNNRYRERFGKSPFYPAYFGYDFIRLIGEVTEGQEMEGDKIVEELNRLGSMNSTATGENVGIREDGEINPRPVPARIVNGSLQRVN